MDLKLNGKRVLITGASSGIGLAIATGFLEEGARVGLMARNQQNLRGAVETLSERFGRDSLLRLRGDCSDPESWKSIVETINQAWHGLDIAVANVGDGRSVPDPLPALDRFSRTWKNNFVTAELTAEYTVPLLASSKGCLLFISSIAGLEFIGAPTDYSVGKGAVIALSKQLARKLAPEVRVNCVAPGNIYFEGGSWDEKIKADSARIEKLIQSTVPMKRFGKPEEIADLAVFLCSERAKFITGACVVADGGQTVGHF